MMRSFKALAFAAFATTLFVASANAQSPNDEYGGYDKDHFGIFIDKPGYHYDKCAFDYVPGKYVDIKSYFVKYDYKLFKKIRATCKIPYYDHYNKYFQDFKCIYVDKNEYGRDDVLYAKDSDFDYYAKAPYGVLTCEFVKKVRHPYPPPYPHK